jgi:hypothetical protein
MNDDKNVIGGRNHILLAIYLQGGGDAVPLDGHSSAFGTHQILLSPLLVGLPQ